MNGRFHLKAREWLDVPERKRAFNERHFAEAASRYDLATRMMSLGRDAAWKRALVGALPSLPHPVCVDLACGTGDVAFLLAGRYPGGVITGVDLSVPMLAIARRSCEEPQDALRGIPLRSIPGVDLGPREHQAALDVRAALLARLRSPREWDLAVVGGGATGLGVALDAGP